MNTPLELLATGRVEITYKGTAITPALLRDSNSQPLDILEAHFKHMSGGDLYQAAVFEARGSIAASPKLALGKNGEELQTLDTTWVVKGRRAIEAWQGMRRPGAVNAFVRVQLFGRP